MTETVLVILLAGPSGSGKSRLARSSQVPLLRLDDFYRDATSPGLPRTLGIVDWDHPASWDADAALSLLQHLTRTGRAHVPTYEIESSTRIGTHELDLGGCPLVVAEGIFAPELLASARAAGLTVDAIYLDRPRTLVAALRLVRDLRNQRKPPSVLLRRGFALWRAQPRLKRQAVSRGFRPMSMTAAQRYLDRLRAQLDAGLVPLGTERS